MPRLCPNQHELVPTGRERGYMCDMCKTSYQVAVLSVRASLRMLCQNTPMNDIHIKEPTSNNDRAVIKKKKRFDSD